MIYFNENTNLLEQKAYKYTLQEVAEPNLYREIYPYTEVPKIAFNHRRVPMGMPENIWITDTTFRDGQQSRTPYSTEEMLKIFDLLHKLSGPRGLVRMSEFFVYSKKDRDAVYRCMERGYEFPQVTTWIRAVQSDYQLLRDIGIKETGILVSCSDYHIFKKLNMTRAQALAHYLSVIRSALDEGIVPRCHLEDITRADYYGFVLPFAAELMKLAKEYQVPVKIRLCDTMGYGLPYSGVALPRSVPGLIYGMQHYCDVPSEWLEWHGHNDFYKGVANASAAWLYGASAVNCSLLGIGERTGNVPLEAMVMEYASLRGDTGGMDTAVITEIAEYFEKALGYEIPPMTPFVGKNFNVTRAGIHADGLLKDEEIYNIFDTALLLNRRAAVAVSNTSGLAGIAFWLSEHFGTAIDKKAPVVAYIKEFVDKEYAEGRVSMISDEEMLQKYEEFQAK